MEQRSNDTCDADMQFVESYSEHAIFKIPQTRTEVLT